MMTFVQWFKSMRLEKAEKFHLFTLKIEFMTKLSGSVLNNFRFLHLLYYICPTKRNQ